MSSTLARPNRSARRTLRRLDFIIFLFIMLFCLSVVAALLLVPNTVDAASNTRGRPKIGYNTLLSDQGTMLRGGTLTATKSHASDELAWVENPANLKRMRDAGANSVRVVWYDAEQTKQGNDAWTVDETLSHLDKHVNNAAAAGLYIVINYHEVGSYNKQLLTEFWTKVAPRYAKRGHVVYEMLNEPIWGFGYTDVMLQDFADVYKIMRKAAPNTPILHISFNQANGDMKSIVDRYTTTANIDWSAEKDVVAFHTYGTSSSAQILKLKQAYPVYCTEWWYLDKDIVTPLDGSNIHAEVLERHWISWNDWGHGKMDPGDTDQGYREHVDTVLTDAREKGYLWQRDTFDRSINVANNRIATASANDERFDPYLAVDGINNTSPNRKWQATGSGEKWLQVDLGTTHRINRYVIHHAGAGGEDRKFNTRRFEIQRSDDGKTWKNVQRIYRNARNITDHYVKPFSARYVRLLIIEVDQERGDTARIYEFSLFGKRTGDVLQAPPPFSSDSGANVALEATTTASSFYSEQYAPGNVTDGIKQQDDIGEWVSNGETNSWIQLDWSSPQTVDKIVIYDRIDPEKGANGGTITFSDGSTLDVTGIPNDGAAFEVAFPAKTITSLRFQITEGEGTNVGLSEFEVYATE